MIRKKWLLIFVFVIVLGGVVFLQNRRQSQPREQSSTITINDTSIIVEIAKTTKEQNKGLSGRDSLPENYGMLFVYERVGNYAFWMKEMKFAIDIIWIGEDLRIVDITKNALPSSFPQTFQPQSPAQYVLEVNSGFTDKNNIKIGDTVDLSGI